MCAFLVKVINRSIYTRYEICKMLISYVRLDLTLYLINYGIHIVIIVLSLSLSLSSSLSLSLSLSLSPSSLYSSANHESDFATFHLSVIKRTAGKGGQKPGCAINLSLKAFHGDLAQLRRDFPITLTQTMAVVHKLGFPDVILPGKRH